MNNIFNYTVKPWFKATICSVLAPYRSLIHLGHMLCSHSIFLQDSFTHIGAGSSGMLKTRVTNKNQYPLTSITPGNTHLKVGFEPRLTNVVLLPREIVHLHFRLPFLYLCGTHMLYSHNIYSHLSESSYIGYIDDKLPSVKIKMLHIMYFWHWYLTRNYIPAYSWCHFQKK